MDALKEKIKAYTLGQLLHAEDVLPTLYELMGKGVPLEETPTQPPVLSTAGHDWEELKDALTLSLTSGSFLDSQFYAPDSKPLSPATPTIRPIYFCSMVGETSMSRITKCEFAASEYLGYCRAFHRFFKNLALGQDAFSLC